MQDQEELFEKIYNAYEDDNLTFFIGAGVSKTVRGTRARLWNDLAGEMNEILGTNISDPLVLAQSLYLKDPKEYERITKCAIDNREISDVHRLIAKLQPKNIITTNWDCLLEKALEFSFYDVIACDKELLSSRRERKLIKMHGDFKHKNIVFKEDDYLNYSKKFPLIENFVKTILYTSNVIFIGYSYNDINLKYIMNWLRNINKKSNILYVMTDFDEYSIENKYYENWKIKKYFCNDKSIPENANNLEMDDHHRAYCLYNFLYKIVNYNELNPKKSIEDMIERYEDLSYVPNYILEKIFQSGNPEFFYLNNRKVFTLEIFSHKRYDVFRELCKIMNNKNVSMEAKKFCDFIEKSRVNDFSIVNYLSCKDVKSYDIKDYIVPSIGTSVDYSADIYKFLDIDSYEYYVKYQLDCKKCTVRTFIFHKEYLNAILEMFRISTYVKMKGKISDQSSLCILFPDNVYQIFPKSIIVKYKIIIDMLTFKHIKIRIDQLINSINSISNSIKTNNKNISLESNDSEIARVNFEMMDMIYFSKVNKICINCYNEIHEYFYICLRYIFMIKYRQALLNEKEGFCIHVPRTHLYIMIEYCHYFDIYLFVKEEMSEYKKGFWEIEKVDIDWMINTVLPKSINSLMHSNDMYPVDLLCTERLGIIVLIASNAINIKKENVVSMIKKLIKVKRVTIIHLIIDSLSIFYNRWNGKLDEHNELLNRLYSYYNDTLLANSNLKMYVYHSERSKR